MKFSYFACFLGLAAFSTGIATGDTLSPVTRVVQLLQQLSKQVETEGKKEEDLYETYVCWAKSVVEEKTNTNAAAQSRKEMLETYIADLDSGRIELTDERANLEKEIEELLGDIELAKATREKENTDFVEAEDEMKKAKSALAEAIKILGDATKDHKKGVLLAVRQELKGGLAAVQQQQANLKHAVELGERFLTKADALFLKRLLFGDVPTVDWKKLNRKASFKMSYKARSFKIQDVLKKMHQTFSLNLKDAQKKESDAKAQYEKLDKAKNGQLDAARKALGKMDSENGAKGMSRQDSVDEVKALTEQIKNDEKFIKETTAALAKKKKEWKARSELRTGELAAIGKTIAILHSDDARDNFKKSFSSQLQKTSFLQVQMTSGQKAANAAVKALLDAGRKSGDERLMALAATLAKPKSVKTKFAPILKAIDKMIALLKDQEKKDLETKQTCEDDRMANTRKAIVASREIDDMSDTVTTLTGDIAKLADEIKSLEAEHKKVKEELDAAQKIRNDENAAWKVTDKDDKEAAETVASAKDVLAGFYKDNKLSLAQQPEITAGEAPPPPPPTWEGGYGGKTGESMGIVSLLTMVHEDILKDQATAKAEEDASQKEFDEFEKDSKKQMKALTDDKNEKEKVKGKKETEKTDTEKSRGTKKGELDGVLDKISKINPNCEFFEVNYKMRVENRQIELDGLEKAKTILNGGSFTAGPDPDREVKPGDAFLQIRRK